MLKQRIVTAVALVGLILAALAADSAWPFAALTLVLIAAAGWEWGRLNQAPPALSLVMGATVALAGGLTLASHWAQAVPPLLWWAAALLWLVGGAVALRAGPAAWPQMPRGARWLLGLAGLWAAWLALTHARVAGINFLLSVLALVWVADIAAYFAGRAFGRRKLAPSISPGKTWEGVVGGMAGVLLLALLWTQLDARLALEQASLYTRLVQQLGWALALPALLGLAGMSVVGDLVESLVKRAAGAKDSSRLLPGHGGVLDRVDALLPVLPLTMLAL